MKKEKICLNRKIKTILKKVELKSDCLVPDIKPDIIKIINTNGMAYLIKEQVQNGKVKLEGNVESYIIYLSDNGENRSISNTISFFEVVEDERIKEDGVINVKTLITNIDAKILNERKVSLTIYLILKIEIAEEDEIEYIDDLENNDIKKLERRLSVKNILSRSAVLNSLKDIIKIEDDQKIIEIFKVDIEVKNKETKMSFNKLLAKAEIEIKILYLDETNNVKCIISNFPLMTFIEIKDVNDNCLSELDYIVRNVFFKIQNEGNVIEFQIDFEIKNIMYEEKNINVIEDVYSLTKVIEVESKDINLKTIGLNENSNSMIKIDEKFKIDNIQELLGYEVKFDVNNIIQNNTYYSYEVDFILNCFYKVNNDKNIKVSLIKIPFIYGSDIYDEHMEFYLNNININNNSDYINIYAEIESSISNEKYVNLNMITNITEKEKLEIDEYNFVVYFVKKDDTLWKIAKKFNVSLDDLIKMNDIKNPDCINIGDKIYIMK